MTNGSQRILVVDDEMDIRELFSAGLGQQGFECLKAADADQASAVLAGEDVDLVLLDIMMPGKSGMELLPEIVDQHPQVAVIMVSAVGDIATGVEAMRKGAYDYVTKPVPIADLVVRVEAALSRQALLLENVEYQKWLELMVEELADAVEEQRRQLTALTQLIRSDIGQGPNMSEKSIRLHTARLGFERVLQKLSGLTGEEDGGEAEPAND